MNSGPAVSETFSRDDRLRKRREFEECYANGVRVSGRHVQVFLLAEPPDEPWSQRPRLGISVPRRVGTAVVRNRVRRRLREIFRRTRSLFASSSSATRLVVNARPSSADAAFSELLEDYRSAVTRALSRLRP